jgi:hypothetical protein
MNQIKKNRNRPFLFSRSCRPWPRRSRVGLFGWLSGLSLQHRTRRTRGDGLHGAVVQGEQGGANIHVSKGNIQISDF